MKTYRHAMNNGEVSPEFWYSNHLDKYYNSNRQMENFVGQISGSTTRRYGTKLLRTFYEIIGDTPSAKLFNYQIDSNNYRIIVFAAPDLVTAATLYAINPDGDVLFVEPTQYLGADLEDIYDEAVGDDILFFHPNYETRILSSFSDIEWIWDKYDYNGGPWRDQNEDKSIIMSCSVPAFDITATYDAGENVVRGGNFTGVGQSEPYLYNVEQGYGNGEFITTYKYWIKIEVTTLTGTGGEVIKAGDRITIKDSVQIGDAEDFDGEWTVSSTIESGGQFFILLITGTERIDGAVSGSNWTNKFFNVNIVPATIFNNGQKQVFYTSLIDSNLGNDPNTSPDEWLPSNTLQGQALLNSSSDSFTIDDENSKIRLRQQQASSYKSTFIDTDQGEFSPWLQAFGPVSLKTQNGIWAGEISLQLSLDGGSTAEDIGVIQSDANTPTNGEILRNISDYGGLIRAFCRERETAVGDTGAVYYLEVDDPQYIEMTILEFTDERNVIVNIDIPASEMASSYRWNFGAFSVKYGYPACGAVISEQLVVSGIPTDPGKVHFSETGNLNVFLPSSFETSAFDLTLGSGNRNNVRWIIEKDSIIVGTDNGEYSISARDDDKTLSFQNFQKRQHGKYGSSNVKAKTVSDLVMYVEDGSKRMHTFRSVDNYLGNYEIEDPTIFSSHLFNSGTIKEIEYVRTPLNVVYVLKDDNTINSWVYEKTNAVSCWSKMTFGDAEILSISSSNTSSGDSITMLTVRNGKIHLEVLDIENPNCDYSTIYRAADFTNMEKIIFPLFDPSEDVFIWDNAYINKTDESYFGSGQLMRTLTAITSLVLRYNSNTNQLIEDKDFVILDCGLIWIFSTELIDVFDGNTQQVVDVDYMTRPQEDCTHITFHNGYNHTLVEIYLTGSVTPAVLNTDYFLQTDGTVVTYAAVGVAQPAGVDRIELISTTDDLRPDIDYSAVQLSTALSTIGIERDEEITVGVKYQSILEPTNILVGPNVGPVGHQLSTEIALMLVLSMGGEYSLDGGYTYNRIPYIQPDVVVGEKLPLETGIKKIDVVSDIVEDEFRVVFRTDDITPLNISSIMVDGRRIQGTK